MLGDSTMKARTLSYAIAAGVLASIIAGLFSNTPAQMVGAVHYGYPLPWLIRMIVAPQYFPWEVDYFGLLLDIIVWTVLAGVLIGIFARARKSSR
jgi:hypothetical protein